MNYIVLDLEWNQSPQGKEFEVKQLPFEIIEIGAVKLNEKLCVTDTFQSYINPQVYKSLHFMTKQIVSVTMDELKGGALFKDACRDFLEWCGEDYIFCTWGSMDLTELARNMKYFEVSGAWNTPIIYFDIQKFFSLLYEDGKLRRTLHYAADFLGLNEKKEFHSALNDAAYTAEIIQRIDFDAIKGNYSIDCYYLPKDKPAEIHAVFDTYEKYISRGFATREAMLSDKEVKSLVCYKCHRKCRRKLLWFTSNNKTYHTLGVCSEHGLIKGKLRIKQSEDDAYYAVKTTKLVDEAGAAKVYEKKKALQKKKKKQACVKSTPKK